MGSLPDIAPPGSNSSDDESGEDDEDGDDDADGDLPDFPGGFDQLDENTGESVTEDEPLPQASRSKRAASLEETEWGDATVDGNSSDGNMAGEANSSDENVASNGDDDMDWGA